MDHALTKAELTLAISDGLFMGILGVIFWSIGISMGWLYLFMVSPSACCPYCQS
jgi:hypothetical protein